MVDDVPDLVDMLREAMGLLDDATAQDTHDVPGEWGRWCERAAVLRQRVEKGP